MARGKITHSYRPVYSNTILMIPMSEAIAQLRVSHTTYYNYLKKEGIDPIKQQGRSYLQEKDVEFIQKKYGGSSVARQGSTTQPEQEEKKTDVNTQEAITKNEQLQKRNTVLETQIKEYAENMSVYKKLSDEYKSSNTELNKQKDTLMDKMTDLKISNNNLKRLAGVVVLLAVLIVGGIITGVIRLTG